MKIRVTVTDDKGLKTKYEFTSEELRGIYTMCQNIPAPLQGSREISKGLKTLQKIVGDEYCRKCTKASTHKDRRGFKVCDDHDCDHINENLDEGGLD